MTNLRKDYQQVKQVVLDVLENEDYGESVQSGTQAIGYPTGEIKTGSESIGLDWKTNNSGLPQIVYFTLQVESDGTDMAYMNVLVDLDGGTSYDYRMVSWNFSNNGGPTVDNFSMIIPPGASFRVDNAGDPNNTNQILGDRTRITCKNP